SHTCPSHKGLVPGNHAALMPTRSDWCCLGSSFASRYSSVDLPPHHLDYQFSQLAIVTSVTLPRLRERVKSAARCMRASRSTVQAFPLTANLPCGPRIAPRLG